MQSFTSWSLVGFLFITGQCIYLKKKKKDLGMFCRIRGFALLGCSLKCKPKLPISFFKYNVDFEIHAETHKRLGFKDDSNRHLWHHVLVFNHFYLDYQKCN